MKQSLLWFLIACLCWTSSTLIAQQTGSIEGVVLDEATEVPIADAIVTLSATDEGQEGSTLRLEIPISFQLKTN